MNKPIIYGVFLEDRLVFKGTRFEICDEYDITRKSFYAYKRDRKLHNLYRIKAIGRDSKVEPIAVGKPKSEREIKIEYLLEHLRIYGNVMSVFDPVPYFPDLYDLGFDCRVREVTDDIRSKVTKSHRKKEVYFITECV